MSIVIWRLGALATFDTFVEHCLVTVQVMDGAETLQLTVDQQRLICFKVLVACLELRIMGFDVVRPHYRIGQLLSLHRLQDALYDRCNHLSVGHEVLGPFYFAEDDF